MVRAFVGVKLGSSEYLGAWKTVKEEIVKLPGVVRVELVFGRYDSLVEIETKDLDQLSRLIADNIRSIQGVISTETLICYQATF